MSLVRPKLSLPDHHPTPQSLVYSKNVHRTVFDAHFVVSLGAEVNNNKRRVSIDYRNPGGG